MKIEIVPAPGTERTVRQFRVMAKDLKDTRKANKQVSAWLFRWVNDNFKTQGGKVGKWPPFKLGGRRIKGKGIDRSAKLLQDTGELRASFIPFYDKQVAGIGAGPHSKGNKIPEWHEFGVPKNRLPARRMLPDGSDADVNDAIIRIYDIFMKKALKA